MKTVVFIRGFLDDWRDGKIIGITVEDYEYYQGSSFMKENEDSFEKVDVELDGCYTETGEAMLGDVVLPYWGSWYRYGLHNPMCSEDVARYFYIGIDLYEKLSGDAQIALCYYLELKNEEIEHIYLKKQV